MFIIMPVQQYNPQSATFEDEDEIDKPLKWLKEIKSNYKIEVVIDEIGQTFNLKNTI